MFLLAIIGQKTKSPSKFNKENIINWAKEHIKLSYAAKLVTEEKLQKAQQLAHEYAEKLADLYSSLNDLKTGVEKYLTGMAGTKVDNNAITGMDIIQIEVLLAIKRATHEQWALLDSAVLHVKKFALNGVVQHINDTMKATVGWEEGVMSY